MLHRSLRFRHAAHAIAARRRIGLEGRSSSKTMFIWPGDWDEAPGVEVEVSSDVIVIEIEKSMNQSKGFQW